jgi:hypothetical protein
MSCNSTDTEVTEVFVYTGEVGALVPQDVVRVRVDPSITSIPARAFYGRKKLADVELCEGLVEIGEYAFTYCGHVISNINIPTTLKRICNDAFWGSLRCPICLHDGIEIIGDDAFGDCIFTNFRVPSLITVIPERMLYWCKSIFSLEIPHNVTAIGNEALSYCYCLRNVAFPPDIVFDDDFFIEEEDYNDDDDDNNEIELCTDLELLFGSNLGIVRELMHRFDELPIHSLVYYHSYNQGVLQILVATINMRSGQRRTLRSRLNPTGNHQDCLGMTPLHIWHARLCTIKSCIV